jgi:outer membrane protein assembly factor BamB
MRSISFWFLFIASNWPVAAAASALGLAFLFLGGRMWRRRRRSQTEAERAILWPLALSLFGLFVLTLVVISIGLYPQFYTQLFRSDFTNENLLAELKDAPLDPPAPAGQATGEWPQWRGPGRDGISRETGIRTDWNANPPKVVWKQPLGRGFSSIAVSHGRLYTMDRNGNQERLVCLDAESGKTLWSHAYEVNFQPIVAGEGGAPGPRATPTVFDGRVYCVGALGKFQCLEATPETTAAKVVWEHDLVAEYDLLSGLQPRLPSWGMACSPLLEGDLVIVQPGGESGSIAAFDRRTGQVRWQSQSDHSGYSSPIAAAIGGVRQIIAMTGERAVGLTSPDGQLLWSYDFQTKFHGNIATPVVLGDNVFISANYEMGCALLHLTADGRGGVTAAPAYFRSNGLMRTHHASCVARQGFLYGFDNDYLKCIDARTGDEKWHAKRAVAKGCLLYVDGRLLILTQNGQLVLADANPKEFQKQGQMQVLESESGTTWALPALADGRLYLRDGTQILCLDLRK